MEKEVDRLRKIYDELKVKATRQRKDLDIMKDSIKDLELDSQRPHMVYDRKKQLSCVFLSYLAL